MRSIRDATAADAAALCAAEQAVAAGFDGLLLSRPDELRREAFLDRIALCGQGAAKYLVATAGQGLVAHASLWSGGPRAIAHVARLDVCVHVGHWRQGHGQALLNALVDWASKHPTLSKIELLVREENHGAIALYRKLGFAEEGRFRQRVRLPCGRFIDDLAMGLLLDAASNDSGGA